MAAKEPPKPPPWSASDRAELDEILEDRKFAEKLAVYNASRAEKRKRIMDAVRGWASLFLTVAAAISLLWDKIVAVLIWLRGG